MNKSAFFSVCYEPQKISGVFGFAWTIRDGERRWRGEGWSAGRKRNAENDARTAIAKLQAEAAA